MATLILSDVHAIAAALDGVLDAEDDVDGVVFLGDAVDIGPQPDIALSTLRSVADHRVIGNHDRRVLDVDPAADPDDETVDEYEQWRQWTHATVTEANLTFLRTAPRTAVAISEGTVVRLHHGDFEPPTAASEWTTRTTPTDAPELSRLSFVGTRRRSCSSGTHTARSSPR